jgi:hypothetical protein
MEARTDSLGAKISTGLYYYIGSSRNFHDGQPVLDIDTSWKRVSVTFTTSANFTANTATVYVYGMYGSEGTTYVRNIQVELNDHATPYQSPTTSLLFSPEIKDCSGYNQDLIIVGNQIASSKDSIRNTSCLSIPDGLNSYLKNENVFFPYERATINCWFKCKPNIAGASNYHIPFSSASGRFEISIEGTAGSLRTGFYVNGSRYCDTVNSKKLVDGNWHMLTTSFDGTTIRRYVDGIEVENSARAIAGSLTGGSQLLTIGHYNTSTLYGNKDSWMSDVRLYATALSADDILDLYQASVSIDDMESLHCYEFVEQDLNNFNKNGTVNFANLSNSVSLHEMKMKVLDDGSTWARIFYHDVTFQKTWFTSNEVPLCLNQNNKYSRMEIVDEFKNNDGIYEFMLTYPSLSNTDYNRWTQTSSPNAGTVTGYTPVKIAWTAHSAGIRKHGGSSYYNCDSGSTWYAPIG